MSIKEEHQCALPVRERITFDASGDVAVTRTVACPQTLVTKSLPQCRECPRFLGIHCSLSAASARHASDMVVLCRSSDDANQRHRPPVVVAEIMSTSTQCISQDAGIDIVSGVFAHGVFSTISVVDEQGQVKGSIGATDLLRCMRSTFENVTRATSASNDATARDVMTPSTFTLAEHTTIAQAAALMAHEGIDQLPIVNERNVLVGVVSAADISRWVARCAGYIL